MEWQSFATIPTTQLLPEYHIIRKFAESEKMLLTALFFLTTLQMTWVFSSRQPPCFIGVNVVLIVVECRHVISITPIVIITIISNIIFTSIISPSPFLQDALPFVLSSNNSRCFGSVCLGEFMHVIIHHHEEPRHCAKMDFSHRIQVETNVLQSGKATKSC